MRPVPQAAIDFIKHNEELMLSAYQDSGGVWTIGWGHVAPEIRKGLKITQAIAEKYLAEDLIVAQRRLYSVVKPAVIEGDLTDHQYGALISFVFNLGIKPGWTIWKRLNARAFDQVPLEMMRFVYDQDPATGKMRKVSGLVNRRADEVKFWSVDEPGSEDVHLTSGVLRLADTPPAASDPVPARKSVSLWSKLVALLGVATTAVVNWLQQAPDWIKHALEVVNPFSAQSTIVQHMVAGLATTAAVVGVVNLWFDAKKKSEARQ